MPKPATQLTNDDVSAFHALRMFADMLRERQAEIVEALVQITGEEGDEDGDLSSTVAWDVVHNEVEFDAVLRRCNLVLPATTEDTRNG